MTLYLPYTTTAQIVEELSKEQRTIGGAHNMVLTLVIATGEADHYDAVRAATEAAREHPSRILVLIRRDPDEESRLDAEIRPPGIAGPGEVLLLRLYGELGDHPDSVVTPLLAPDAPIVVWWPGVGPSDPSTDPLGRLAQRRITDAQRADSSVRDLLDRVAHYHPGDTDLTWTRITPWRSLLASTMDRPCGWVTDAEVEAEEDFPSADLLAAWLADQLEIPVRRTISSGPAITGVRLITESEEISVSRPDGRVATLSRTGRPDQRVALPRRGSTEALAEELRRLDADEVYHDSARSVGVMFAEGATS
ncbi:glucose-6-phosphate dehydrogenase assembly protein OpcA [Spiractinospora alimapuensis]|uniref:glucose-6-phosphate dehydrogenase assembly protein OpcA n=1 Tax=Spiractinospora alimapuensis TaxID=2820884 RepID=UPI001F463403|nr:glucose-6-phosphate dehydrogenase assembly protein OpcA [Spiractinospora alimapuensis]QVQ52140.1 glucose-6-phosphate dehydrogenase assembly protein OpcA [Spiractinospora alimapuensis]